MKILVIICSHEMNPSYCLNIKILNDFLKQNENDIVDYCGISNNNDFNNYQDVITFKYTMINEKRQLSKICDFITRCKNNLDYDWYIKTRPEIKLLESIDFNKLSNTAINARSRVYKGPQKIKYGMSVNGCGPWKNIGDCFYVDCDKEQEEIILDDQIYIFHKNIIEFGGFEHIDSLTYKKAINMCNLLYSLNHNVNFKGEHEWVHTYIWKIRNISLNVIGINALYGKGNFYAFSGDVNM
jgi:hypothetical protein